MKTQCNAIWIVIAITVLITCPAMALPTIGPAGGITSSNATFAINGASGSTFVFYGITSGHPSWKSENATPVGGVASITIWGSLFGAIFNTLALGALWVLCGRFVEVVTKAFNSTITIVPTFQDAVTGFTIQQYAWTAIMVIIMLGVWLNYFVNSSNPQNQEA